MKITAGIRKVTSIAAHFFRTVIRFFHGINARSIRTRLISAFMITIIPILLLGLVSFYSSRDALKTVAVDSSLSTLSQGGNYLNLAITNVEDLSVQIISNATLQNYLDFSGTDDFDYYTLRKNADNYLNTLLISNKLISNIYFIQDSGTIDVFRSISGSMEQLADKVGNTMGAISEMDSYKVQTVSAIENISAVSEQTAASSEEVTASTQEQLSGIEELTAYAQQLNEASQNLMEAISEFKVE